MPASFALIEKILGGSGEEPAEGSARNFQILTGGASTTTSKFGSGYLSREDGSRKDKEKGQVRVIPAPKAGSDAGRKSGR